jgi:P27 family predicted phage terminase small subunit
MHLKLVRGNPGKRSIRGQPEPQRPKQLPDPPDYLLPEAKAEWRRIAPELSRLGLLTLLDIHPLAAYCESWARWVLAERLLAATGGKLTVMSARGSEMPHPLLRIADNAAADMIKFGSEFGLTPASRVRVGGGGDAPSGKFDGLLA